MTLFRLLTPRAKQFLFVLACMVGVGFLSFVPHHVPRLYHQSLIPVKEVDSFAPLVSKLHKTKNTFNLKSPIQLVLQAHAAASYDNASSYIAIDMDNGQIIEGKNPDAPLPIASLTKVMSSVIGLDLMASTDEVTISQYSSLMPATTIGVVPGQKMQIQELLHAMLMTSANDAAQALHDGVNDAYHSDVFVRAMNEKATFLGLTHSHFANAEGFDDSNNYSSVKDLALLSHYALTNYPVIASIAQQDFLHMPADSFHKQYDLNNWNGLLGVYPGVYGLKIGNTGQAGYTTIVASERNGHRVLVVLLGTPGVLERDQWAADLLDTAFNDAYNLPPVGVTADALRAKYATWQYWN